ncbi:MAG: DMT family transporter [Planctomycetota bacterium]
MARTQHQPTSADHPPLSNGLGVSMAVLTLVQWSAVPLFLHHFARTIDLWTSNGWRYGFAAILWLPVAIVALRSSRLSKRDVAAVLVPAMLWFLGQTAFGGAHYFVQPGMVTFAVRVQILFVLVGSLFLVPGTAAALRRSESWIGATLLIAGTVGVAALGPDALSGGDWFGIALAMGGGGLLGLYAVSVQVIKTDLSSLARFSLVIQAVGAGMLALMITLGDRAGLGVAAFGIEGWILLGISAIVGIAAGHITYFVAIRNSGVVIASGTAQLQPFLVLTASAFLFDEVFTVPQLAAGIISVVGAVMLVRSLSKHRSAG